METIRLTVFPIGKANNNIAKSNVLLRIGFWLRSTTAYSHNQSQLNFGKGIGHIGYNFGSKGTLGLSGICQNNVTAPHPAKNIAVVVKIILWWKRLVFLVQQRPKCGYPRRNSGYPSYSVVIIRSSWLCIISNYLATIAQEVKEYHTFQLPFSG